MSTDTPDWADKPDWASAPEVPTEAPVRQGVKPVAQIRQGALPRGGSVDQPAMAEGLQQAKGLAQTGANMVVGALAAPVAGIIGAGDVAKNLLQGKSFDESMGAGADLSNKIQQKAGNIIPQNPQAQAIQQGIAKPFEAAKTAMGEGARYVGEAHGMGPQGQLAMESVGQALPDVASTLFGAVPAMRGARTARGVVPKVTQPQDAVLRAKQNGYLASPVEANPTVTNKAMTAVANADKLNDEIAIKNAENTTRLVKKEIGIPEDKFLDADNLTPIKREAEKHYEAIQQIKDVNLHPDDKLRADLLGADKPSAAAALAKEVAPEYYRTPAFERIRAELLDPAAAHTPASLMVQIADLRADAGKMMKRTGAKPQEFRDAMAMKNVATTLEDFLERKLSESYHVGGDATAAGPGPQGILPGQPPAPQLPGRSAVAPYSNVGRSQIPPAPGAAGGPIPMGQMPPKSGGTLRGVDNSGRAKLIENWKAARQKLAKIHDIEDATNLETGRVDPARLAKIVDNGGTLTGNLADIVQAHKAMPHVVKDMEKGSQASLRAGDSAVGGALVKAAHTLSGVGAGAAAGSAFGPVGAGVGAGAGLAVPLATRKLMSSGLYQKYMTHPSPALLDQIRAIDPKTAVALAAASASRTNSALPAPMEAQK